MKLTLICGAALAAIFSLSAGAQSCASPNTTWQPNAAGTPPINGDTCAAGTETGIVSLCGGGQSAAGHAYVVKFTAQAAGTFTTISLSAVTGFTGYMGVVNVATAGACNGGGDTGTCQTSGDATNPVQHANLANGTSYYLIVSNSGSDAATACGTFTLTANGTLPVTLQDFSVI